LAFDPATKRVWAIEHGPRGGDEINLIQRGKNYGWPVISFGKEYHAPIAVGEGTAMEGMEQPIQHYVPSIAPSSLLFYTGDYYPGWQGSLFAGALALMHLNRIVLDEGGQVVREERYLLELQERIRNVVQGPDGRLYLATDTGKIMVLENN
jgi:aldose sugar dehydrogenase